MGMADKDYKNGVQPQYMADRLLMGMADKDYKNGVQP